MTKTFDSVWIDGLLQAQPPKLAVLHSPYNLIVRGWSDVRIVLPYGRVISSRHAGWGGSGWIGLPVLFSLYVYYMPSLSHHVELALYADETSIIAKSRKPTVLVSYLESYLNDLQRWLSEWKIAINVSKAP